MQFSSSPLPGNLIKWPGEINHQRREETEGCHHGQTDFSSILLRAALRDYLGDYICIRRKSLFGMLFCPSPFRNSSKNYCLSFSPVQHPKRIIYKSLLVFELVHLWVPHPSPQWRGYSTISYLTLFSFDFFLFLVFYIILWLPCILHVNEFIIFFFYC